MTLWTNSNWHQEWNRMIRGPLTLAGIHSSGRSMGLAGNMNVYLDGSVPGETVTYTLYRRKQDRISVQPLIADKFSH